MCDTLCVVRAEGTLFAKNSDRPWQEAQVVESRAARPAAASCQTQYLSIPGAPAAAVVGSRPTWLWGFEHGVNEHRVAIGNEKVWTVDDPRGAPAALIGMDVVRLALERGRSADEAFSVATELLERYGQGGSGEADHDEPYHSSFLIAQPGAAWILETSDRTWAARRIEHGPAAISNRISLRTDHTHRSPDVPAGADFDRWRAPAVPTGLADHRLAATSACAASDPTARSVAAALRDHGTGPWGAPGADPAGSDPTAAVPAPPESVGDDWSGVTVCMHVREYQATTASMITELPTDPDAPVQAWFALGSPCSSVYVPAFPPWVAPELARAETWQAFAALARAVEHEPSRLAALRSVLGPVEAQLWEQAEALAAGHAPDARARRREFALGAFGPVARAMESLRF